MCACSGDAPERDASASGPPETAAGGSLPAAFREFEALIDRPLESIDPAGAMLALSAAVRRDLLGGELDAAQYVGRIESLAEGARQGFAGKNGKAAVAALNALVYDELGMEPVFWEERIQDVFLDSALDRRKGSCLALAGLYVSLAYRLGLPVKGVLAPGHFFVRYDDGDDRVNIETLRRGIERTDDFYGEWFGVPTAGGAAYMKGLDTRGTLAVFLFNVANAYREAGRLEEARALYEKAASMLPGFPEVHGNLGVVYFGRRQLDEAVASFRRAVELNPLLEGAHRNLALIYENTGRAELAREHRELFERAKRERLAREARRPHGIHRQAARRQERQER